MKFEKHFPSPQLRPYIKYFVVSENEWESEYKVFPCAGLVLGFQYRGQLATVTDAHEMNLAPAGITGITDGYRVFKNSEGIGSVLVYFTETGFAHFASPPAHELFNTSLSLEEIFNKESIAEVQEKLALATTDTDRIQLIERFLVSQLKAMHPDRLILEAVRLIYQSKGTIRIQELKERLCISASPLEKRFRKVVGTTPKKFASIVRFQTVLENLNGTHTWTEICYGNNFFDQAHFIKDFKRFTGDTPEDFKRQL